MHHETSFYQSEGRHSLTFADKTRVGFEQIRLKNDMWEIRTRYWLLEEIKNSKVAGINESFYQIFPPRKLSEKHRVLQYYGTFDRGRDEWTF